LLDEIAGALAGGGGVAATTGGNARFFIDALHFMNTNLVELPQLAGYEISLPVMRSIVNSAPMTPQQAADETWRAKSACYRVVEEADQATRSADKYTRASFDECRTYWLETFPNVHPETRGIIVLMLSMLVRPFVTPPLSRLFSEDTNVRPEDTFDGKIIIVDIPVQEYRLVGRLANLAWKYCFQVAVLRRIQSAEANRYLRPVFLWADEAQNFITDFDAEYQAVARSAGGCTVYLTQNRESYRRVLGTLTPWIRYSVISNAKFSVKTPARIPTNGPRPCWGALARCNQHQRRA